MKQIQNKKIKFNKIPSIIWQNQKITNYYKNHSNLIKPWLIKSIKIQFNSIWLIIILIVKINAIIMKM